MKKKISYHINPKTGVPNICRAQKGNCPYGGDSGSENHFDTFSEAQKHAEEKMKSKYQVLPSSTSDEVMDTIHDKRIIPHDKIESLEGKSEREIINEINTTSNKRFIAGVIRGELKQDDWDYVGAALQNDNLAKGFIDNVTMKYPDEFEDETVKLATASHQLSHTELMIIFNKHKDKEVQAAVLLNRNLDREYVKRLIKNKSDKEMMEEPYSITLVDWKYKNFDKVKRINEEYRGQKELVRSKSNASQLMYRYTNIKDKPMIAMHL